MSLAGLQVSAPVDSLYGVWADCIVGELVAAERRRDDSGAAMLLLALVFGAPPSMRVTLPRPLLD